MDYLYGRLLDAEPRKSRSFGMPCTLTGQQLLDRLWTVAEKPAKGQEANGCGRLAALAAYDPENPRWDAGRGPVVEQLVAVNPILLGFWMRGLPARQGKAPGAAHGVFRDRKEERTAERSLATNILADYAADQPEVLADLVMDADEKQFAVMFPKLKAHGERAARADGEIDKKVPSDLPSSDEKREKLAKRQANAAVALLRMHQPAKVWPLLKHSPDPRGRSYLIHRLVRWVPIRGPPQQSGRGDGGTIRRAFC